MINYQKNIFLYVLIFLTVSSYFLGYHLDENAAGAGLYTGDLGHVWKNLNIYLNNSTPASIVDQNIYSNRPPLLYLFHKYINPLTNNIETFRLSVFLISLFSPFVFYCCLRLKFRETNKLYLIVLAVTILLSPYYRTSSFWGLEENFGIISSLIAILFFLNYEKNSSYKNLFALIFFSSICVYLDQKLLIVPLIFFLRIFFSETDVSKKLVSTLLYLILALPYSYLVIIWNGIFPPSHSELHDFNTILWDNLIYAITIMSIYFLPFIFIKDDLFLELKKLFKNKIFIASFGLILFLILYLEIFYMRPEYSFHTNLDGGGAIRKLLFVIFEKNEIQKVLLYLACIVFWPIICIFVNKNNLIIFVYFLIVSLFIYPLYQETFDPILFILITLLIIKEIRLNYKKIIFLNLYFTTFLICSVLYYN